MLWCLFGLCVLTCRRSGGSKIGHFQQVWKTSVHDLGQYYPQRYRCLSSNYVYPLLCVRSFLFYFEGSIHSSFACVFTHPAPSLFNYPDVLHLPLLYLPSLVHLNFSVTSLFSSVPILYDHLFEHIYSTICAWVLFFHGSWSFWNYSLWTFWISLFLFWTPAPGMHVLSVFCWPSCSSSVCSLHVSFSTPP